MHGGGGLNFNWSAWFTHLLQLDEIDKLVTIIDKLQKTGKIDK